MKAVLKGVFKYYVSWLVVAGAWIGMISTLADLAEWIDRKMEMTTYGYYK